MFQTIVELWKTSRKGTRRMLIGATVMVVLYFLYKWNGEVGSLGL